MLGADALTLKLGTSPVDKVYLGEDLVYGSTPSLPITTDTFSRHAAGDLSGKVSETGQTWFTITGPTSDSTRSSARVDGLGRIQGNYDRTMSYVDVGSRNGTFTGTVAQVNAWENWPSCSVGATAAGDRYYLEISGYSVYLERVRLGVMTNLAIFAGATGMTNGDVYKMCIEQTGPLSNRITLKQNGTTLFAGGNPYYDDTDGTYVPDGTYSGVGSEQLVGWSNYRFDPNEIL